MTTVAVVGTGRMGGSMARAIAAAGHPLIVQNRTRDRAEALAAELGARVAGSPAEAASLADVTITMLSDDAAVEAAFTGTGGLVEGARAGTVLVDSSTVRPDTIRSLEGAVRATGAGLLDAPVSGSVGLAASGQLTLMVGGDAADLERARPALEPLAKAIFHLGPLGSGAAMKLAVNTVIFGLNGAVAEALVLAESAGVDLDDGLRRPDRQRGRRAVRRLQARRVPRARDDAPGVRARAGREGPWPHPRLRRLQRRADAPVRDEPRPRAPGRRRRAR